MRLRSSTHILYLLYISLFVLGLFVIEVTSQPIQDFGMRHLLVRI